MQIDRVQANRYIAFVGFTLSFLFVLAIVVLALTVTNGVNDNSPPTNSVGTRTQ